MSIHNFLDKIKGQTGIDNSSILFLFIIVVVGVSSFGLGRLSLNNNFNNKQSNIVIEEGEIDKVNTTSRDSISTNKLQEGRYVASKNGKMYYSVGCSGAKRIKPENEIWFNTKEEAEKAGYELSSLCK